MSVNKKLPEKSESLFIQLNIHLLIRISFKKKSSFVDNHVSHFYVELKRKHKNPAQ